jgi:hypothetical protein
MLLKWFHLVIVIYAMSKALERELRLEALAQENVRILRLHPAIALTMIEGGGRRGIMRGVMSLLLSLILPPLNSGNRIRPARETACAFCQRI